MNRTKTLAIALLLTHLNCAPCLAGMPFYQSLSPSDANTEKMLNKELSDANNAKAKGYKISYPLHAWTLLNLARVKENKKEPEKARYYIDKSVGLSDKLEDRYAAILLCDASQFYYRQKNYNMALRLADKALSRANSILKAGSGDDSGHSGWPLAIDRAMDLKAACLMQLNRGDAAARIYYDELNMVKRVGNAYVKKSMLLTLTKKGEQMTASSKAPEQYLSNFESVARSNLGIPIRTPSSPPGYDFCRFK